MAFDYMPYIREAKMPHMWCPGCGIGTIMKSMIRAFTDLEWAPEDLAVVSGIGCTSRLPGYLNANTLHTTHGRALSFATGIKMHCPDKHVVVISGDGDGSAIGGNHLIHAARRNIDITVIINNNNIYGMTGGQYSPTTPLGAKAATAPYGNLEPSFDLVKLVQGAGASFVARAQVGNGKQISQMLKKAFAHKGMSFVEIVSNCHTQFGRRNKMADPMNMVNWINDRAVPLKKFDGMSEDDQAKHFPVGVMHEDTGRTEYTETYEKLIAKLRDRRSA
ncbi:MAG TPA: 2-oxoglutarate ferredoxin oxidoreductase subunit beta [Bacteroidetes bacterium]|nr:2-oxoglutarate oxidoreductase subunit KorB [bacterium BMS3Bbin04]HDO64960.1 2-oxoglutarate ferredoxin oxidoreductase subunit beta [Bacteroidota bacterium]HEX04085.1 2-oxoglutarate ferredoxin oxidoreductase subunit beta [Bacteroidota bacterium]